MYYQNRHTMLMNLIKSDPRLTLENKPAIMDFIISGSNCTDTINYHLLITKFLGMLKFNI